MTATGMRRFVVLGLAVPLGLALASAAAGQGSAPATMHNATRLGGATAFYSPPLRSAASLKQMAARRGMADDIRTVLRESGIPETADAVMATLTGATSSVKGGSCDAATPADGTLVACEFQPGSTLLWMAFRPNARKGDRTPGRLDGVRWAGDAPFKALLFRVTNNYRIYTFVLPMACANLSLASVTEIEGEPVDASVDRVCDPKTGTLRATFTVQSKDLGRVQRVSVALDGRPAGEMTGSSWTYVASKPGDYTFDAVDSRGTSYPMTRRTLHVDACAPPPVPEPIRVVAPTCGVALSSGPLKRGYEVTIDATGSATGTDQVAPAITVELRGETVTGVAETLTLDSSRVGRIVVRRPGTYRVTATVSTPHVVEVGSSRYEGTASCEASIAVERPVVPGGTAVFFDILGGKERRVRPIEDTDLEFAQCSPLIGLKIGAARRFHHKWEVAGSVGAAISLVTDDEKVTESALFVDAEVNRYLTDGVFVGTGLSFWDLTRSETWTPAWLLHFGLPLAKHAKYPMFLLVEGRMFFDHADDVTNNYQVWGGVRVKLGR
jgi:hypothetical protein